MADNPTFIAWPANRDTSIDLTVVVPAWNEERRLPAVLTSLDRECQPWRTEILVVDDGSTDLTGEIASGFHGRNVRVRVVRHPDNRGKGAAVRTGVLAATGGAIAFVDADDATHLSALAPMLDALGGPVGAVFGSRHVAGSVVTGSPLFRGVMGRVFNHLVRFAGGTSISDTQCGAKVFDGAIARVVFDGATIDGFAFDVEILRRLVKLGVEVVEHPVRWAHVSGTKVEIATPLHMLIDIARLRLRSSLFEPGRIECRFGPKLAEFAKPLDGGARPAQAGDACTVLSAPSDTAALRTTLDQAGLVT